MDLDIEHTFVISDCHFGSGHLLSAFNNSLELSDEEKIFRWNSVVKPDDVVIYVGDFCDSTAKDLLDIRTRLNGKIIFVKGNHDELHDEFYEAVFDKVCDAFEYSIPGKIDIVFVHIPVFGRLYGKSRQVYGHVHDEDNSLDIDSKRSFCACAKRNNWTPVSLKTVLSKLI